MSGVGAIKDPDAGRLKNGGWSKTQDPNGRTYYFHRDGRTTWAKPAEFEDDSQNSQQPNRASESFVVDGVTFRTFFDEKKNKPYYLNTATNQTTWKLPEPSTPKTLDTPQAPQHQPSPTAEQDTTAPAVALFSPISPASPKPPSQTKQRDTSPPPSSRAQPPLVKSATPPPIRSFSVAPPTTRSATTVACTGLQTTESGSGESSSQTVGSPQSKAAFYGRSKSIDMGSASRQAAAVNSGSGSSKGAGGLGSAAGQLGAFEQFAHREFHRPRQGIFRNKAKVEKLVRWQKDKISAPLLRATVLSPFSLNSQCTKCFEYILEFMGDKHSNSNGGACSVGCLKSLLTTALQGNLQVNTLIKDEIVAQILKQCTFNPNSASLMRGYQLLSAFLSFALPSLGLREPVFSELGNRSRDRRLAPDEVKCVQHCLNKLKRTIKMGEARTVPSDAELQRAKDVTMGKPIFGARLDDYFEWQTSTFPSADPHVPLVLLALAQNIERIAGLTTEGLFRLPGDSKQVELLKDQFADGNFDAASTSHDVHVCGSLFKLWLRELADPVIPDDLYNRCLQTTSPAEAMPLVDLLVPSHRDVLVFVMQFLARMCQPEIQSQTKMTADNLAVVFAPNFLRNQSTDPLAVMRSSQLEQRFVKNLILGFCSSTAKP